MNSRNSFNRPIAVIGSGSFGTAMANMLGEKTKTYLYSRRAEKAQQISASRQSSGFEISERVISTNDLNLIAGECEVIFPIVPAGQFRSMMKDLSPLLRPYHILIHGTKGIDVVEPISGRLQPDDVKTMSEVIREESDVLRIGCLAGPNLARELADKHPAATVVASPYKEVIEVGQKLLRNEYFQVYSSFDLKGIELCGVLKNIIAIAAGALQGLGYGENARSLLISRGLVEIIYLGRYLGGHIETFLGLAGVGDLVATASSNLSRNFTVGYRLAKGEKLPDILNNMDEVAEGVNTIKIMKRLLDGSNLRALITEKLHAVLFHDLTVEEALRALMKYPLNIDVNLSSLAIEK
jgi:glycerol-3-phosphate dehydrogenase (NAD(P)+)